MWKGFRCERARDRAALGLLSAWMLAIAPAGAQIWETAANHPGDSTYAQVPYDVVFVAAPIVKRQDKTCTHTDENGNPLTKPVESFEIGTDVLAATTPSKGNALMVVTRIGAVRKLFPLPFHETQFVTHPDTGLSVPLIDTPAGMLANGSVVEPNVSEDGKRVIFGYFHDVTFKDYGDRAKQGADLYTIDLTHLDDPQTTPASLSVQRLTFKEYQGNGNPTVDDKNKKAMNPVAAEDGNANRWGTVFMHGVEMRTTQGLKMVYVSGESRNLNSNDNRSHGNYNLNLNIADINASGSLGARRQF